MSDKAQKITITPEGLMAVTQNDQSIVAISDKSLSVELSTIIKSVGIENLTDVDVHKINKLFGSISHYIRFVDGGEVKFSYNAAGDILELYGKGVNATIKDGNRILFAMNV